MYGIGCKIILTPAIIILLCFLQLTFTTYTRNETWTTFTFVYITWCKFAIIFAVFIRWKILNAVTLTIPCISNRKFRFQLAKIEALCPTPTFALVYRRALSLYIIAGTSFNCVLSPHNKTTVYYFLIRRRYN